MSNPTIITNENIKDLVKKYIKDKSRLPQDLKNIAIGDWDVSNVTNMSRLFCFYNSDEDLDNSSHNSSNDGSDDGSDDGPADGSDKSYSTERSKD